MKPPAFQLYADDFLAGVIDMTDAEVGIYIRLLCLSWNKGHLDFRAIRAASFDRDHDAVGEVLRMKFVEDRAGRWYNPRLETVRAEQANRKQAGSKGGSKTQANRKQRAKQTSSKPSSNGQADGVAKVKPPTPTPTPTPTSSPNPNKAAAAASYGFALEKVDINALRITASAICQARPRSLDREFVWRACMLCEAIIPGLADDIRRRLTEGKIDNPTSYIESIIRQETKLTTRQIREAMEGIAVPGPAAP